jgi:ABC-type bacteriocin/lantibiotic exporter with double-glycine peptidase domain
MRRRSSKPPVADFNIPRFTQISESHCGPAVMQMLLSHVGIEVTQEQVAAAAGIADRIETHGTRVDQMAQAVRELAPQAQFWYKEGARFSDLIQLVNKYRYPVGVEWQGLFTEPGVDEGEPETEDTDYGHYSVVTHVSRRRRELIIADPYKDYISQARIFTFAEFLERWWDTNEVIDAASGLPVLAEDYHMLFIVAPVEAEFPTELGMKRG